MKRLVFVLFLILITVAAHAANLVEGRIYMKDGSVIDCTGADRMQLPGKAGKIKIFRNAYLKTKYKETLQPEDIDSVLCWHSKSSEYVRKLVFAQNPGWMWVYFETPHIRACVYSAKGYYIGADGGIFAMQRRGWFSNSHVDFYLRKQGKSEYQCIGNTYRRTKNTFREGIADYIEDDAELAERVRRSDAYRDKTILMLREYNPDR